MRASGAILLIACYELGHQPLSLASPLAILRRAGYQPVALDASVEPPPDEALAQARLVCISVPMHTAMRLGGLLARRIRAVNPGAHICFYGLYAALNAEYLLRHLADSVIGGEYEEPLLALVEALEHGEPIVHEGISTRERRAEPYIRRIPFIVPDRAGLPPLTRYARFRQNGTVALAGYTETSRGCLHTCRHCPIPPVYQGRFFVIPREVVLADIRQQVAMGARHITFGDPDFFNGPGHSLAIVRRMHQEFPHLTFDITAKIEHILEFRRYFPELKALGCAFVVSAVESLSDTVLEKLQKGHTRADVIEALAILDEAGIPLRPSFIPFTPWATLADYLEILRFVEDYGLIGHVDPVQYTIRLLIPPGSPIPALPDAAQWLGPLDADAYTYRWTHPDPRMDELHRQVSALVEDATLAHRDVTATFYAVWDLAASMAGLPARTASPEAAPPAPVAPGLTEAWFC